MQDLKSYLKGKKKSQDNGSSSMEKDTKMDALKGLRGMASDMMKDGMKATVMAKDKKGLETGLDTAKKIVAGAGVEASGVDDDKDSPSIERAEEKAGMDLDGDNEQGEAPEHKAAIMAEGCSESDIDAMIKVLEDKKREMKMG